jgi:2,3-bisphosphoglycerate-independent phosphoglycerate mutase
LADLGDIRRRCHKEMSAVEDPFVPIYEHLVTEGGLKIVFLVLDGLGGYGDAQHPSELEAAKHPNLDALAESGCTGLLDPVVSGITPGSGPGHLGLFGYDPLVYEIGRGALSAAGVGFDLESHDVAARVNICNLSEDGTVSDRRAGRLPTEETAQICSLLSSEIQLEDAEVFFVPEKDHRALLVLRADGLSDAVADTDPQRLGVPPLDPRPLPEAANDERANRTVSVLRELLSQTRTILAGRQRGNFVLLRGFARRPFIPSFGDRYRMRALALAQYPMYLGLARLLGMKDYGLSNSTEEQLEVFGRHFDEFDFFYFHVKATDAAGEDGDFDRKRDVIEEVDSAVVPVLSAAKPSVLVVTGDHSTPTQMAAHSWHPVPVLLCGGTAPIDSVTRFDERSCAGGWLGRRRSVEFFPVVLAAAGRLAKYGA